MSWGNVISEKGHQDIKASQEKEDGYYFPQKFS